MDISRLSMDELRGLQLQIPQEMKRRGDRERLELLRELRALARARGYSLEELMKVEAGLPKTREATGTVKAKYRHPDNPGLEWTGRGRKPKWVESWLENGGELEILKV